MTFPEIDQDVKVVVFLFTSMAWLAFSANLIVIWSIFSSNDSRVRVRTNFLICIQAITDVLIGSIVGVFGLVILFGSRLPGSSSTIIINDFTYWHGPSCTFIGFSLYFLTYLSMFTLLLISWERYMAISRPLKKRVRSKKLCQLYLVVWITALIFACTPFAKGGFFLVPDRTHCQSLITPGVLASFLFATIVVAISALAYAYWKMYKIIRKVFSIHNHSRERKRMEDERKIAKQFFLIVVCFTLLFSIEGVVWFCGLIGAYQPSSFFFRNLELAGFVSAMFNATLNPFLYAFLNNVIRRAILKRLGLGQPKKSPTEDFSAPHLKPENKVIVKPRT